MGAVTYVAVVDDICDRCDAEMLVGTRIELQGRYQYAQVTLCPQCIASALDQGTGWKYKKQVEYAESCARYPILTGVVTNGRERKRRRVIRRADGSVDLDATLAARRPTVPETDTAP